MTTEDCMTWAKRRVSSNRQTFRKWFILCCWVSECSFTNLYGAMVTCWICWWSDLLQIRYVTYIHPSYLPKHQIICFDLVMHIREREKKKSKWTCKTDECLGLVITTHMRITTPSQFELRYKIIQHMEGVFKFLFIYCYNVSIYSCSRWMSIFSF